MDAIKTYTNTKCELEMAKIRLSLLMDRKEQLYAKYFPVTQSGRSLFKGQICRICKEIHHTFGGGQVDQFAFYGIFFNLLKKGGKTANDFLFRLGTVPI